MASINIHRKDIKLIAVPQTAKTHITESTQKLTLCRYW